METLLLVITVMLLVAIGRLDAQETVQADPPKAPAATLIPKTLPLPEVPEAKASMHAKLKRMTITGAGAFPFALFYTNFVFDSLRFAGNNFQAQYAPWPFKNQFSAEVETSEKFLRLGVSIGASAVVGILDALIQRRQ